MINDLIMKIVVIFAMSWETSLLIDKKEIFMMYIMKTSPCNEYPHKPFVLYSKTGVCRGIRIFLILPPNHRLCVVVRTAWPRRFYHVPTIYVLSKNKKNIEKILLKIFNFYI